MIEGNGKHRQPRRRYIHRSGWFSRLRRAASCLVAEVGRLMIRAYNAAVRRVLGNDGTPPPEFVRIDGPQLTTSALAAIPPTAITPAPAPVTAPVTNATTPVRPLHPLISRGLVEVEPGAVIVVSPNRPPAPVPLAWQSVDDLPHVKPVTVTW